MSKVSNMVSSKALGAILSPKKQLAAAKETFKNPGVGGVAQSLLGGVGQHITAKTYSDKNREQVNEATADATAAEQAQVAANDKAASDAELEAKRKLRAGQSSKRGRRSTILGGALGSDTGADISRAKLGG